MPILFYDGLCGLCDYTVRFLQRVDRGQRLLFAPLQGETAIQTLGRQSTQQFETLVFWMNGMRYERSEAVLRALMLVGGLWSLARVLLFVPVRIRDRIYDFVSRRRYAWFGKRDACRLPTAEERARFLP